MLKKRDLHECTALFELMSDPTIMPFVRHKASSADEYWFLTKQMIEEELAGTTISRTIISDYGQPIGTINLFDIEHGAGFLGTWIGTQFQGQGYNKKAKEQFLEELFFEQNIQTVFLRIRKNNIKSIRATEKLGYALKANDSHQVIYEEINKGNNHFDLYYIPKDLFLMKTLQQNSEEEQAM
ncbi:GNAT family N-acetyltransferase [Psychrobacillus sp. MER TA 171]|uniref:GNAT family N-acetyltransferase n=1 Tax=Psychrobacillus sp. MER TA 171 TaxID=2939577 RepID=UPI002041D398|nr:GNAT family N-acetyltransferase [Psychrobacillus sp. MER TA 171]